jgi:hypothetical protein
MTSPEFVVNEAVSIRKLGYDERWLEEQIIKDPALLGLGPLKVKGEQVIQPRAGRMDLLLADQQEDYFYETELMLEDLDESHIIRAVEYWDLAKRYFRNPDIEHIAVIVAEDVTSRFFNVITLISKLVPIIALQVSALKVGPYITLHFTKVLDLEESSAEEPELPTPKRREDWPQSSLAVFDACFELLREVVPNAQPSYKQQFIGVMLSGQPNNFVKFYPRTAFVRTKAFVNDSDAWASRLGQAGLEVSPGGESEGSVRFRIRMSDLSAHRDLLKELFTVAHKERG